MILEAGGRPAPARLRGALPRRLAALFAAGLAVLGAAACDGSAGEDYRDDFVPLSRDIVSLDERVQEAIETAAGSTAEQLAGDFSRYAEALAALRRRIAALDPPEDLAKEQEELVAAMGEVRGSLEDIARKVEQGDIEATEQASLELVARSEELRDARGKLARSVRERD
jgi:hypothetical protein